MAERPPDFTPRMSFAAPGLGQRRPVSDLTPAVPMTAPGLGDRPTPGVPLGAVRHLRGVGVQSWLDHIYKHAEFPPRAHGEIYVGARITLGASASRSEIINYRLPPGSVGVIRFFGNSITNASDVEFVEFSVLVNGSPVAGWANFVGIRSPAVSSLIPVVIPLTPSSRIEVVATNTSASAISGVAAVLRGWQWAQSLLAEDVTDAAR